MNLQQEIRELVAAILQIPADELDTSASFFDEYGMDSLRALEILADVENKYNITIDPDNLMKMTCIDEVVKLTESYLKPHE